MCVCVCVCVCVVCVVCVCSMCVYTYIQVTYICTYIPKVHSTAYVLSTYTVMVTSHFCYRHIVHYLVTNKGLSLAVKDNE